MSSSFKPLLLAAALLFGWASTALGINLAAVYYSACRRDIGVIAEVDERTVDFITLAGEVRRIPRFDIIYIAYYPAGFTPIVEIPQGKGLRVITVKTLHQNEIVELVKGWVIDFSEEQLSFLTVEGLETVVNVSDIWDLKIEPLEQPLRFENRPDFEYRFRHPYPFSHCPQERGAPPGAGGKVNTVFPQFLLGDPLLIKKELDRLEKGHRRIREFETNQVYYPVPQLFGNDTELGFWLNVGSRYGASANRANSSIPALRSELSEGPFGFQRVLITGAAPMEYSIQEEVQTQFYYALKSDYLNFSMMYDIGRIVVGEGNYVWRKTDLDEHDDRINQNSHIGGGFDRGPFSFNLSLMEAQYAVRHGDLFFFDRVGLTKVGLSYHNRFFRLEFFQASGSDQKPELLEVAEGNTEEDFGDAADLLAAIPDFRGNFHLARLNLHLFAVEKLGFLYSMIYRKMDLHRVPDLDGQGELSYASESLTNAVYLDFPLGFDLTLSGYLSLETLSNEYGTTTLGEASSQTFVKGGVGIFLKI